MHLRIAHFWTRSGIEEHEEYRMMISRFRFPALLLALAAIVVSIFIGLSGNNDSPYHQGDISYGDLSILLGDASVSVPPQSNEGKWIDGRGVDDWSPLDAYKGTIWGQQDITLRNLNHGAYQRINIVSKDPINLFWDGVELQTERSLKFAPRPDSQLHYLIFRIPPEHYTLGNHQLSYRTSTQAGQGIQFHLWQSGRDLPWFIANWTWRISEADLPEFATADFDDSDWSQPDEYSFLFSDYDQAEVPEGVFWIRFGIVITGVEESFSARTLFHDMQGSREIYWDGQLVGGSGIPANSKDGEKPGRLQSWQTIPIQLLSPGYHQIAIRASANYPKLMGTPFIDGFELQNLDALLDDSHWFHPNEFPNIALIGFYIAVSALFLLIYLFAERRSAYLLFFLLCSFIVAFEVARLQFEKNLFDYTAETVSNELRLPIAFYAAIAFLFPAFLLAYFSFTRKMLWLGASTFALALAMFTSREIDQYELRIGLCGAVPSLAIIVWATIRSKPNSSLILASLTGLTLLFAFQGKLAEAGWEPPNSVFFLVFMLVVLIALTRQLGKQRELQQRTLIENARIEASKSRIETIKARTEAELLKTSIQPHFLINTLTALIEWIEQEPAKSVEFIQSIERHFDILLRVSSERLIPLSQELELCRSFLEIMSFRKLLDYRIEVQNIEDSDTIPPLTIHTLVENGVTHNDYQQNSIVFALKSERDENCRRFSFLTPNALDGSGNPIRSKRRISRGTGFKYARMRLEESYPGKWNMRSDEGPEGWTTVIEIPSV